MNSSIIQHNQAQHWTFMDQTLKPLCRRVSGDTGGSGSSSQRGGSDLEWLGFLGFGSKIHQGTKKAGDLPSGYVKIAMENDHL